MDITEETLLDEAYGLDEEELLKEAWPVPPEDYTREFEEYLMEIGLRI